MRQKISKIALAAALLCGSCLVAQAEDVSVSKTVVSGKTAKLYSLYSINPNCTTAADFDLKLVEQAQHGAVAIEKAAVYPFFPKDNVRSDCNARQVQASVISYTAEQAYTGDDKFLLRSIDTFGNERVITFSVTVKN